MEQRAERYYKLRAMVEGATTAGERVAAQNVLDKHVAKYGRPRGPKPTPRVRWRPEPEPAPAPTSPPTLGEVVAEVSTQASQVLDGMWAEARRDPFELFRKAEGNLFAFLFILGAFGFAFTTRGAWRCGVQVWHTGKQLWPAVVAVSGFAWRVWSGLAQAAMWAWWFGLVGYFVFRVLM